MNVLTKEKFRVLAEKYGWSLAYSEGYVDGEILRRHGKQPPNYPLIGMDEYSEGFRAGNFVRRKPNITSATGFERPKLPVRQDRIA